MNQVTIIIPLSREIHMERLFASLEMMDCDRSKTNLLVYVDGDAKLYIKARNFVVESKFDQRLCVHRPQNDKKPVVNHSILMRRHRIALIMNEIKEIVAPSEYIMCIEDDTIVPRNTLKRLLNDYYIYPYAGMIQGIELGRWGIPYIGAWKVDDVYEPTEILSLTPKSGIVEVDAGGFYCFMTKYELFKKHKFETMENDSLGPDVNFGLWLRQIGHKNYADFNIRCEHRLDNGKILTLANTEPAQVKFTKQVFSDISLGIDTRWEYNVIKG